MKRFGRWTALMLAGLMFLLSGCGSAGGAGAASDSPEGGKTPVTVAETEKSMGRYLEQEITLPEDVTTMNDSPQYCLQKMENGELALLERMAGLYISKDNGETWEAKASSWLRDLPRETYVSGITLAPDGSAAIIYVPHTEDSDTEGTADETEDSSDTAESIETVNGANAYRPEYLYVNPDGEAKTLKLQLNEKGYLHQIWFGKDSRLYGYSIDHKVYEIDPENETSRELFETEGLSAHVCFTDQYMVIVTSRGVELYDLEKEMPADEDKALNDFIMEHAGDDIGANSDSYSVVMAEGEQKDVIYFAFREGLYRHAIGGTAMEQIIDGNLTSLGDPMMYLKGMTVLPDNEFAILYGGVKLYHYVYDPDIPTVPDEQVSVYSLKEDYAIRQAVSLFQKQNPEVYVRYEVGMTGDGGITAEDAVKNLNTKMMSGSGPDLLVLDGLPAESYKEKGILMDISAVAETMSGEDSLFPNLVDACRKDGKLYFLPVCFRLPILEGDSESVSRITDLKTMADVVEELRRENPEGSLIGLRAEEEVLHTLGMNSSGAWIDESGRIDEAALKDFLTQAKRIYQAETAGMDEEELRKYKETYKAWYGWIQSGDGYLYDTTASSAAIDIGMGEQKIGVGVVYRVDFDFSMVTTLANQEKNFDYGVWQGQTADCFLPRTMVGVCAGSAENELALKFFRYLFGKELQDIEMPTGFPMNMASFDKLSVNPRADESEQAGISIGGGDGDSYFSLDIRWPEEKDFQRLKDMVQSAKNACIGDRTIEDTVCEIGVKALNGSASVEDTVAEIVKKAAIYLAE